MRLNAAASVFCKEDIFMSVIDTYRNNITRRKEAITKLLTDKARESTKIANASKKIDSAQSAIKRTSNQTMLGSGDIDHPESLYFSHCGSERKSQ